jgi:hypothetical protein
MSRKALALCLVLVNKPFAVPGEELSNFLPLLKLSKALYHKPDP